MSTLSVVLLAVIAVAMLVQAACLVRLSLEGRRTVKGFERIADQILNELTPAARDLTRVVENAAVVTDQAVAQVRRLDDAVGEAADAFSRAGAQVYDAVVPNLGRVAVVTAAWRLVKRFRGVYQRVRG